MERFFYLRLCTLELLQFVFDPSAPSFAGEVLDCAGLRAGEGVFVGEDALGRTGDALLDGVGVQVLDCTGLEGCRRYCEPSASEILAQMIAGRFGGVHLLGSGDYHYLTKIITDSIREPFSLLLLDHHPDMQVPLFGGVLSCGGWVRDMLETNPMLRQVTIIGINPSLKVETEGFGSRVRVFCEGAASLLDPTLQPLSDQPLQTAMHTAHCPQRQVDTECQVDAEPQLPLYVSIDKDVLCPCYARTSWDQGSLTLPQMETILRHYLKGRRLLGADICGSVSFTEGGSIQDFTLNNQTDKYLIDLLNQYL